MDLTGALKAVVQCDFDGTITEEDISFQLLDAFADGDWRQILTEHKEGKISVSTFNTRAFMMIKENKKTLDKFVRGKARLRAGFPELLAYCQKEGLRFVIVSNGLAFYIKTILDSIGVDNIEMYAAQTRFSPEGIKTKYIGPEGIVLDDGLKEAYIRQFLRSGYRIKYIGNGVSDIPSARRAHHIFATGPLLDYCKEAKINCTPFSDLNDVVRGLKLLA